MKSEKNKKYQIPIQQNYIMLKKKINDTVKNNFEKFPERFSWKLTIDETLHISRSKNPSLNIKQGTKIKYGARVFIEQGIMMLATVLKTKIATKTVIIIMDTFFRNNEKIYFIQFVGTK